MTETNSKIGFRQFPITLKFVVIWIFFLCLGDFWATFNSYLYDRSINIVTVILAFAYFYLAIGLADRSNGSRILTSVLVGVGILVRFVWLIWLFVVNDGGGHIEYNFIVVYQVSFAQGVIFLVMNILFDVGILYILLRPSTKALFMRTPPRPIPPPEVTSQESA